MSSGALKSMGYDHPDYLVRKTKDSIMVAGSGGVSGKFIAHAAMLLMALHTYSTVAGTSTYTYTQGGTATVAIAATQLSLIRITNTQTASNGAVGLSTTTFGPYTVGGVFNTAGTLTNQIGAYSYFQLNTSTGTAGFGGVAVNQGDQFFVVNGTDATAVELVTVEYQTQPGASVIS